MNNLLKILALQEQGIHQVSFVNAREEGGINTVYDPVQEREVYQVFIHSRFPYQELHAWDFDSFDQARSFAARQFAAEWEVLSWNLKTDRPCEKEGVECGQRNCETCRSLSGGEENKSACSSCGALDD